jgi:hypothetical protein
MASRRIRAGSGGNCCQVSDVMSRPRYGAQATRQAALRAGYGPTEFAGEREQTSQRLDLRDIRVPIMPLSLARGAKGGIERANPERRALPVRLGMRQSVVVTERRGPAQAKGPAEVGRGVNGGSNELAAGAEQAR